MTRPTALTTQGPTGTSELLGRAKPKNIFSILGPYRNPLVGLAVLAILANLLTLCIPKLVAHGIDSFQAGSFELPTLLLTFVSLATGIFLFTSLQNIVQVFLAEKVAYDLRQALVSKISRQDYHFIENRNPSKLLTNITSDIDAIKMFVSQVIVSLVTSAVIIIGTSIILLVSNWRLAVVVLMIIPLIGGTFFVILKRLRSYFMQGREVVDWLNRVIKESIVGAALIRVLASGDIEQRKFQAANANARSIGLVILQHFALLIPVITFVAGMGTLMVVTLGGYFVIQGSMTLGSFAAFLSYVVLLIFPILVIGFMSNIIAQASASHKRIQEVIESPEEKQAGNVATPLLGGIDVKHVSLSFGEKPALKNVSLSIAAGTRTAIIGPTAAGKSQLLNVVAGLSRPQSGLVEYDGRLLSDYDRSAFYPQVGLVFQDSAIFNTTLRENIAFRTSVSDADLRLAIETAELSGFIEGMPQGLDTQVSERGTSLSGGQKQRIMLARALVLNPKILFLDDFTARVDPQTETKILANIARNYPDLTLVSITQKIAPIAGYDQILLLMEGEILARGTHQQLMHASPEYVQIYNSQRSTSTYELPTQA